MKSKGWSVDDIKISQTATGMNFIYILKTPTTVQAGATQFVGNQAQMEANILAKLEQNKKVQEKVKEQEKIQEEATYGQSTYVEKCQSCHGVNGELIKGDRAVNSMTVEDMQETLKDYTLGLNGKESSIQAPVHVSNLNNKTIRGIYAYLKSLNNPSNPTSAK
jgi:cytochrome c553